MDEKFVPGEGIENEEIENEEIENTAEAVEETTEEVAENTAEEQAADESFEDVDFENVSEEPAPVAEEESFGGNIAAPEKKNNFKTSAIIAWVLVAVLALGDVYYYMTNIYNKYNHMGYLDTNGYTIGDAVAGMGMDFDEFKDMYGLPKDMRKDTYMNAAQSMIPISKMAELNNMDFETLKTQYNFGDEITEKSTWGEAIDTMKLKDYVGEDSFDDFKKEYELGDEITLDTKWGDIRKTVEQKQVDKRLEEKAKKQDTADNSNDAADSSNSDNTSTDTNADTGADANADNGASADTGAADNADANTGSAE